MKSVESDSRYASQRCPDVATTLTLKTRGKPGIGVHGVGEHAPLLTKSACTVVVPTLSALNRAVSPLALLELEIKCRTFGLETVAGLDQDPPVPTAFPVMTNTAPTCRHTGGESGEDIVMANVPGAQLVRTED